MTYPVLKVEKAFQMPVVYIFFDTSANNISMLFQQVGIAGAHLGGYLVAHMNQLAEIGIVIRVAWDMAKGIGKFLAAPRCHFSR